MKKATDFKNQWLSIWWAHQDSNQGPKDYEQLQEKNLLQINRLKLIYIGVEANVEAFAAL
jgi:hypothetical protein